MPDKESDDHTMVERGKRLEEYLDTPFEEGGPGPSDGEEMGTIIIKDIIKNKQQEIDGKT